MHDIEILGFVAGALSAATYLPTAVTIYRDPQPDVRPTTIAGFVVYLTAMGLWAVYGVVVQSPSMIASNSLAASVVTFILAVLGKRRCSAPERNVGTGEETASSSDPSSSLSFLVPDPDPGTGNGSDGADGQRSNAQTEHGDLWEEIV